MKKPPLTSTIAPVSSPSGPVNDRPCSFASKAGQWRYRKVEMRFYTISFDALSPAMACAPRWPDRQPGVS